MKKTSENLALVFISMGLGRHVPAPGTAGSLLALCIAWCIPERHFYLTLLILLLCLTPLSVIAIRHHLACANTQKDPGYIVIDECIGMWSALLISPLGFVWQSIAFIFFRFLDIKKPGIIGYVDGLSSHNPLQHSIIIIADDIIAGILAGGLTTLIHIIYHYGPF
jgi:phosphatidylglycerophosphatase A